MLLTLIVVAILAVIAFFVAVTLIGYYNKLVSLKNRCENGFAQIDIQLRRRYDLIPNLVECVRGYMKHESETLENVIAARNQAMQGLSAVAANPNNATAMQSLVGAEAALGGAMGRMSVVMERYPELQANESVATLTEELTSTENKIAFARQFYNDWATTFNTYRQSFPVVAFAASFGFGDDFSMLEMEDRDEIQQAPKVSLTNS